MKSDFVRARIEPEIKKQACLVLDDLGITQTQLIVMLYRHIIRERRIPFDLSLPNELTRKTLEESARGKNIKRFDSVEELFDDLGI